MTITVVFPLFLAAVIGGVGLATLVLLPRPYLFYSFIFILSFGSGLMELIGIQPIYIKVLIEISVLILLFYVIWYKHAGQKKLLLPGWQYMLSFGIISAISFMMNKVQLGSFLYFFRIFAIPYFLLIITANFPWHGHQLRNVLKLIAALYLLQPIAALVKLATCGPAEYYIGTISVLGGSITTIIVMLATSYLAIKFSENGKIINIILLFSFLCFGMIGLKRALIAYIPFVWILSSYLYAFHTQRGSKKWVSILIQPKIAKTLLIACGGSCLVFYLVIRLNPTLNPEGKYWGSFDLDYVQYYVVDYNTRQNRDATVYTGRLAAPQYVWSALSQQGVMGKLFGLGAGIVTASRYSEGSKDYQKEILGLGYGARNGIWFLLLQVGVLGVVSYLGFIFYLFQKLGKQCYQPQSKFLGIAPIIGQTTLLVYVFDTLTYSKAMMTTHALILPVMWLIGVSFSREYMLKSVDYTKPKYHKKNT